MLMLLGGSSGEGMSLRSEGSDATARAMACVPDCAMLTVDESRSSLVGLGVWGSAVRSAQVCEAREGDGSSFVLSSVGVWGVLSCGGRPAASVWMPVWRGWGSGVQVGVWGARSSDAMCAAWLSGAMGEGVLCVGVLDMG